MKLKKEHIIIFLIQVTEVLGFSLILPFLPLYAESLGASPIVIGLILTSFSFFQFFTSPILGKLSDSYGRKPLLIFSQISTFLSFIILGFANTLWLIFISRIVDGLFGSNFSIAQAYLSDISSKKDRSKVFGLSGAAFGFGFLIGPAMGGYLSTLTPLGYRLPGFVAAGITLLTIFITLFFLKETVKIKKNIKLNLNIFHFEDFFKYFKNKKVSNNLFQYFFFLLSHMIFTTQFALFVSKQYGFGPREIGFLLTYVGATSVILRGFLLPKLIDFFGEKKLLDYGLFSMIIGLFLASFVKTSPYIFIVITFFSFGSGINRPLLSGSISRKISEKEQGSIMGVTNSLGSISQMIAPLIGGFVLTYFIPGSLALLSAITMSIGFIIRKNSKNY
jgi:MFS transporter, DHA1 family, tetracycline resistance protein